jgi:hypothetical protein
MTLKNDILINLITKKDCINYTYNLPRLGHEKQTNNEWEE